MILSQFRTHSILYQAENVLTPKVIQTIYRQRKLLEQVSIDDKTFEVSQSSVLHFRRGSISSSGYVLSNLLHLKWGSHQIRKKQEIGNEIFFLYFDGFSYLQHLVTCRVLFSFVFPLFELRQMGKTILSPPELRSQRTTWN